MEPPRCDRRVFRCKPCQMVKPVFEQLSTKYAGAVFMELLLGKNQDTCTAYDVQGFPTFILLRKSKELARFSGADTAKLEALIVEHDVTPKTQCVARTTRVCARRSTAFSPRALRDLRRPVFRVVFAGPPPLL